jgi:hypothetical protein
MKSSDTIPEAAGGEGGHGVAGLDGVIHRYRVYLRKVPALRHPEYRG